MPNPIPKYRSSVGVAACRPVDTSGLPEGVPVPEPMTDDTIRQCQVMACGQDIWVGPRKLALADAGQAFLACMVCAVKICDPNAPVVDLDPGRVERPRRTPGP